MNNLLNRKLFPEYTLDYISNVMGLRKPQSRSLKILDDILDEIPLSKNTNLANAIDTIHGTYPIFSDFEHNFMSLTFALATGVGKTKLMGTFITYLYTNKGVRNFFVVAPNITIYEKLKNDLGNPSTDNEKYVFRGISCYASEKPNVWMDEDYRNRPAHGLADSDSINIYIFNISKFNSDERNMKSINEYLGQSFFDYLKGLDDLVLIMDESHHYRAQSSAQAINDLNPVLGLELTATPQVQSGSKTILFKNVVYEYPLSQAIKDGYTRTPYALTRRDIKSYNFTEEELDKVMINDGIVHHENIKVELEKYSFNNNEKKVKPFMLIVCKNTDHAQEILDYIKSDAFRNGNYKDKVIMVHSNQSESARVENTRLLLDVEKPDNLIEIVIHVNILKEGWDVNNLYTIVPLRTATSRTLREQTIGRGLRLPFGRRTGDKMVDSVTITAHDKFDEIIQEAQRGDSIFHADGIIYADNKSKTQIKYTQSSIFDSTNLTRSNDLDSIGLDHNNEEHQKIYDGILHAIANRAASTNLQSNRKIIKEEIKENVKKDLGETFKDNTDVNRIFELMWGLNTIDEVVDKVQEETMYIPKIRTEHLGNERYIIQDFDLDISKLNQYVPIENEILLKNLLNSLEEITIIKGSVIDFDSINPSHEIVKLIREKSEIDYEKCPELIQKVVKQFLDYYRTKYSEEKVRNIVLMYKKDIVNKISEQIIQHLAIQSDDIFETVEGIKDIVYKEAITFEDKLEDLYTAPETGLNIKTLAYQDGIHKSLRKPVKFDSDSERKFAIVCEMSPEVIRWLRPAKEQFNITYNRGKRYEPDFVVEDNTFYYLVEVKRRDAMNDPDVLAKKDRAIKYCKVASEYNLVHGHKAFRYLFIPHDEINTSSSFKNLKDRFIEEEN